MGFHIRHNRRRFTGRGRRLTTNEMHTAEKCIELDLTFGIDVVFKAAVKTVVEQPADLKEGKI